MPKLPDPKNAVELNLFPGDTLIVWIDGNSVWAMPSSEVEPPAAGVAASGSLTEEGDGST